MPSAAHTVRLPLLLAPVVAAAAFLAGCGGDTKTVTQTATTTAATAPASTTTASTSTASTATTPATTTPAGATVDDGHADPLTVKGRRGDGLTLFGQHLTTATGGMQPRIRVKVTLLEIRGPFSGFDLAAGRKLIGLTVRFTNLGAKPFSDPLPSGQLSLVGGEQGKQTNLIVAGRESPCKNPSLKLRKGETKEACLAFDVPKTAKLEAFSYATDSGYGDVGLWRLR